MRRRDFLQGALIVPAAIPLIGCGSGARDAAPPAPPTPPANAAHTGGTLGTLEPTPECAETEDNIEGPYYRPGAPMRADFRDPGMPGTHLTLTGRVLAADCAAPIAGALLDVWQANAAGQYDNDGHAPVRADQFVLRGKITTDAQGAFRLDTIVPGRYLNGDDYRPAHIHVKLSAPGRGLLTTQLYFHDDPYNSRDPWIRSSLIMRELPAASGSRACGFDFVLV